MLRCLLVFLGLSTVLFMSAETPSTSTLHGRWSEKRINDWYADQPWLVGANYVPRNAINQIEMWQADTFDPEIIEEELGWAAAIGMNTMRVFLHDLVWEEDPDGLIDRIDTFLKICQRYRIRPMVVFFDGVWDPHPYLGPQRPPRAHVHNSGWVQSPGRTILGDPERHDELRNYVKGIMHYYANDRRILAWDLFNEPDNLNQVSYGGLELAEKADLAHALLIKAFTWAREVNPRQPITTGIWRDHGGWAEPSPIFEFMLANSDFLTFHNYSDAENLALQIEEMKAAQDRPLMCTEYMARGNESTFDPHLGIMRRHRVGAYNWGLVDGKSQTKYPWATWREVFTAEPQEWHHDIFRSDGTPYRQAEVDYIRGLTK
ncbi:MAG: cellulase family glycosylhydrolase [Synoicihabitans sp.]